MFAAVDRIFADYAIDSHIPGLVYGIVANGRLAYVRGIGVSDLESNRPVTPKTLFRIASMTKAFTALTVLKLRDDGKLQLDALAETYVPELRGWKYPTQDSPRVRVRDLLNHTAGFVTDDPWGDRQTPLSEPEFSRLLREGVPFARTPATAMEYSNLGFALLGRIITNVSGHPYADSITHSLLQPLGMESSGFFVDAAPRERRALGDHVFQREYLGIPLGGQASPFTWDLYERATQAHTPLVPPGPAFGPYVEAEAVPIANPFRDPKMVGGLR